MEKKTKYLAVVSHNGWKESKKILERYMEKYGSNITVAELLNKFDKDVVILN